MNKHISGFPPVADENARILILGSMPGAASLRTQQYYAHPRNHFWPVMGEITGAGPALPYARRLELLRQNNIALWDVLQCCVRPGSLDSSITDEMPNDFASFFAAHRRITHVFFNGQKAAQSFRRHVLKIPLTLSLFPGGRGWSNSARPGERAMNTVENPHFTTLPSTSPAHASWTFERKLAAWRRIYDAVV
ncbi:MAG: DNA-deoxyinosine glycosylase [Proteobacteria bacterium]|nr:DNA-deoxyinosine glycosylase [Pseudomonadota bacterium]